MGYQGLRNHLRSLHKHAEQFRLSVPPMAKDRPGGDATADGTHKSGKKIPATGHSRQNPPRTPPAANPVAPSCFEHGYFKVVHPLLDTRDLGRLGEKLVYAHLCETHGAAAVDWVNKDEEAGGPYDLVMKLEDQTVYVEVKTTENDAQGWWSRSQTDIIPLSLGEMEWMLAQPKDYWIYRVYWSTMNGKWAFYILRDLPLALRSFQLNLHLSCILPSDGLDGSDQSDQMERSLDALLRSEALDPEPPLLVDFDTPPTRPTKKKGGLDMFIQKSRTDSLTASRFGFH